MMVHTWMRLIRLFPFVKRPRSLRSRLALWNVLVLVLTLLLLGGIVYSLLTYALQTSLDKRLTTQGEKLQVTTWVWLSTGHPVDKALFQELINSMHQNEFTTDDLYIKLFSVKTGKPLQFSPNLQQSRIQYDRRDFAAAVHGNEVFQTYRDRNGDEVRVLTMPLQDGAHHTIAVAQIGRSLAAIFQVQTLLVVILGIAGGCAILVAYGISFLLTRREVRPLSILSAKMRNLSVQGLGARLESHWQTTEVALLTEAFNQMSQRLEASFNLQRNFVADVSHELRTPLTSLRGQVEVLLMNPELSADVNQDVQQIRAELIRLSHLVSNLLAMARVETGILPEVAVEQVQRVELDLLVVEIARQARFLNQHVSLVLGQLQQVWALGDADMLKQMLLNIIDNALTYTPAGGEVELEVVCTHDLPEALQAKPLDTQMEWAMIGIRDTGPGIASSDLPHIFERHYRARQASLRSQLGAGIGLSLARLIAQAHQGEITVKSELAKGATFQVWLPVRQTTR